jgi:hypothetical protein
MTKELDFEFDNRYDRVFKYTLDTRAYFSVGLDDRYRFDIGFSAGGNHLFWEYKGVLDADVRFAMIPVNFFKYVHFNLFYMYETMPEYQAKQYSVIPSLAFKAKRAGITLGYHTRFVSYYNENSITEAMIAFNIYLNILNNEKYRLGLVWANHDKLFAGNFGAYFLRLRFDYHFNKNTSVNTALSVDQTGGMGLTTTLFGLSFLSGVSIKW